MVSEATRNGSGLSAPSASAHPDPSRCRLRAWRGPRALQWEGTSPYPTSPSPELQPHLGLDMVNKGHCPPDISHFGDGQTGHKSRCHRCLAV